MSEEFENKVEEITDEQAKKIDEIKSSAGDGVHFSKDAKNDIRITDKNSGAQTDLKVTHDGEVKAYGEKSLEVKHSLEQGQKLPTNPEFVSSIKQRVIDAIKASDLPDELKGKLVDRVETTEVVQDRIEEINKLRDEAIKKEAELKQSSEGKNSDGAEVADDNPMQNAIDNVLGIAKNKGGRQRDDGPTPFTGF